MSLRHQTENGRRGSSTIRDSATGQPPLNPLKSKPGSGKGMTELHRAVISADHQRLAELLQQHSSPPRQPSILTLSGWNLSFDINERDKLGRTALHWAVTLKDLESVETLLQTNCRLGDKDGRTPLHDAAIHGWYEGILMLLPKYEVNGTNPESLGLGIQDNGGRTALHWFAKHRYSQIIEAVRQSAWKATDNDENSAMPRVEAVEILLAILAGNQESDNKDRKSRFDMVVKNGQEEIGWLCFQDPKLQSQYESIALSLVQHCDLKRKKKLIFWAMVEGYTKVVQALLERGAEFKDRDSSQRTPLFCAAENDHEAIVRILLEKNVDPNAEDKYKRTPLSYAAKNGHEAIVRILSEKNADPNAEDDNKRTSLSYAAENGHAAVAQLLLKKGAGLDAKDKYGRTPLWYAAENGHAAVAQLLPDNQADVNAQSGGYGNALYAASEGGHEKVVQILLDRGADVNAQGGHYGNALQAASYQGHEKVVQILLDRGADVNAQDGHYYGNALQAASIEGQNQVVQILLDKGADVNAQGGNYGNALEAARRGRKLNIQLEKMGQYDQVEKILLQKMDDVKAQEENGNALQAASSEDHDEAVQESI